MGSGSSKSSQIHSLHIEQNNTCKTNDVSHCLPHSDNIFLKTSLKDSADDKLQSRKIEEVSTENAKKKEYEGKIKDLEHMLAEAESENLDLVDRIQSLEDQVKSLKFLPTLAEEAETTEQYAEIIKTKEEQIAKLEQEKLCQEKENNKIKTKLKKKIKQLTQQLNEAKQETSIQMFEMKDEITKLREDNQKLKDENLRNTSTGAGEEGNVMESQKMLIVVELSNQVSEQADKIQKLEQELESKERIIQELLSKVPSKVISPSKSSLERFAEDEEKFNLRRLSDGLQGYIKPPSRESSASQKGEPGESRYSSGASRDSGIGNKQVKRANNYSKSSSESDDWDSDEPSFPSKIHSAPADTISRRTSSRGSSGGLLSPFPCAEEDKTCESNSPVAYQQKKNKNKKMSFLQRHFQTNSQKQSSPMSINTDAFEKETTNDDNLFDKTQETGGHFFLTQVDSQSALSENL